MPTEEILRSLHSYIHRCNCKIGPTYNEELGLYLYDIYVDMSKAYNALSSSEKLRVEDLNRKLGFGVRVGEVATALKVKKITKLECAILDIAIIISNKSKYLRELNEIPCDLRKLPIILAQDEEVSDDEPEYKSEMVDEKLCETCESEANYSAYYSEKYKPFWSDDKVYRLKIENCNNFTFIYDYKEYKLVVTNFRQLTYRKWLSCAFKFMYNILKENEPDLELQYESARITYFNVVNTVLAILWSFIKGVKYVTSK